MLGDEAQGGLCSFLGAEPTPDFVAETGDSLKYYFF